ncbi:putative TPR repeat-containing protein [Ananas comosus]|uniref:Putative TPR repeat-containing protein n=1 Tax=Ananas comosus TaxID=4615 RepID=A0A199V2I3_ANACO|nr:putative TPR repeat-containing protein [Ananas comosus]
MMASGGGGRAEKVRRIFERFDANRDGGLNREEMAALVVAVNPRVKFSDEQISAILDEVFRTYAEFIRPDSGLSLDGLLRTYDDGAGDVDRDFDALSLRLDPEAAAPPEPSAARVGQATAASSSSVLSTTACSPMTGTLRPSARAAAAPGPPPQPRRLRSKHLRRLPPPRHLRRWQQHNNNNNFDSFSEAGGPARWAVRPDVFRRPRFAWDETGRDYLTFLKELAVSAAARRCTLREEAFDNHMVIGALSMSTAFRDALISFRRACELQPTTCAPTSRRQLLYALGRHARPRGVSARSRGCGGRGVAVS